MIFLPYTVRGGFLFLLKTTVEPASLAHAVQEQVWAVDRNEIVLLTTPLEDFLQRFTYATPEFGLLIATPLAGISLLLVIVGVFSVMAYTVSLQTQEIGIRMALGAQQSSILQMILTKGARLLATGIVLGLFASYGLTRFPGEPNLGRLRHGSVDIHGSGRLRRRSRLRRVLPPRPPCHASRSSGRPPL